MENEKERALRNALGFFVFIITIILLANLYFIYMPIGYQCIGENCWYNEADLLRKANGIIITDITFKIVIVIIFIIFYNIIRNIFGKPNYN